MDTKSNLHSPTCPHTSPVLSSPAFKSQASQALARTHPDFEGDARNGEHKQKPDAKP